MHMHVYITMPVGRGLALTLGARLEQARLPIGRKGERYEGASWSHLSRRTRKAPSKEAPRREGGENRESSEWISRCAGSQHLESVPG